MEFFRNPNIDFLGKKWYFIILSLIVLAVGIVSMGHRWATTGNPVPLGVDFRGGTLVYVKFTQTPNEGEIRSTLEKAGLKNAKLQRIGKPEMNELLISLDVKETNEQALDAGKNTIIKALETNPDPSKIDLNNAGSQSVYEYLLAQDPLHAGTDAEERYRALAQDIIHTRDTEFGGAIPSFERLSSLSGPVLESLKQGFYLSNFGVRNVEIVGPQVGEQLQAQATRAVLYSLAGMLVYLWFRFELIYGVAAVVAVFHDTIVTLGFFSLSDKEISLTVIAAILTLVGYSMNDTIVVFDRVRENLKLSRRENLTDLVNRSINETLSRTVLTSGLTFLTVLSLYLFGGEVLHGFSFALVVGIIVGSYSSIFIAVPLMVAFQDWRARRKGQKAPAAPAATRAREKARAR